jgi:hypothetical protein
MTKPRPDFVMGRAKLQLLATTQVLINLHRGNSRAFEWVRALEAMCNGCVVVSEHSPDVAPLVPGEHLLLGRPRTLPHLVASILRDRSRLERIRFECYEKLKTELTMRSSAQLLVEVATDVLAGRRRRPVTSPAWRAPTQWPAQRAGDLVDESTPDTTARPALPLQWLRRPDVTDYRRSHPADRDDGRFEVVIAHLPGGADLSRALESVDGDCQEQPTIHVCLGPGEPAPGDARLVIHEAVPGSGWGAVLNKAARASTAAQLLVMDSGDVLIPGAVRHLRRALLEEPGADAAYGMAITPHGLISSSFPFEATRVAHSDYLVLCALWRRSSILGLGGWSEEAELGDDVVWEFWWRLAVSKGSAALVPRPLVRQSFRQTL